MLDCVRINK
jgi:hypothetical protein